MWLRELVVAIWSTDLVQSVNTPRSLIHQLKEAGAGHQLEGLEQHVEVVLRLREATLDVVELPGREKRSESIVYDRGLGRAELGGASADLVREGAGRVRVRFIRR